MRLNDTELWEYIREDLPYFDLTTHMLELPAKEVTLSILTRQNIVCACSEEAARIAELLGCKVLAFVPSKTQLQKEDVLLEFKGSHEAVHEAWRLTQILLEYACGMATNAQKMLQNARTENPNIQILTTRKSHPFAKRFSIRSLLCGGVYPHRLGLSESVLIFPQHRELYENAAAFSEAMKKLKSECIEKKLVIESHSFEDAKEMLALGADVLQIDKCDTQTLKEIVTYKNLHFPHVRILAAGGINNTNAAVFAGTGVDALVTSALYQSPMADLTSKLVIS
ncbi:MAG: ModD protein [Sulfurimonas sp.]|nr:ModD protein [Sulfurimonas sp.]MBU3938181.1 ModD protein [bacterium]MBU4025018.1 ModD protein [bacterium]MBU4058314.1 ModD protein [bacterium]MBU4110492.1 ModD protein [bacterium]